MRSERGGIAWMVHNQVTPNILMLLLVVGGFLMFLQTKQEVFPEFSLDLVTIRVPYLGASPEEVEQGIVLVIEEAVRGVVGIDEIRSSASENIGTVIAELADDADAQRVFQDIKQEIDRIRTFPDEAEDPVVSLAVHTRPVLQVELYGAVSEWALRHTAEDLREALLLDSAISQVDLVGTRELEVQIAIPAATLRRHGLTLAEVAQAIDAAVVEIPGGVVETAGGDILVRVRQRRDMARDFATIPIISNPDGSQLTLGELGLVRDDFADSQRSATYNGQPAIGIEVSRVGKETPIGVSTAVRRVLESFEPKIPAGMEWAINRDMSDIFADRAELLVRNGALGLLLVLLVLGIFLELKLAFWVTLGIPISFFGSFIVLPLLGVSINMVSMFAFIVSLGIVVDDAIVAGENIYEYRQRGMNLVRAAIQGARDVAMPVTFAVLTNVIAFAPLAMVPGFMGKVFFAIPAVVVSVFLISLIESLLILPAHLAHSDARHHRGLARYLHRWQQSFSHAVRDFIQRVYGPLLDRVLRIRYLFIALAACILLLAVAWVKSGRIGVIPMPRVESDRAVVSANLPLGSPVAQAEAVRQALETSARQVAQANGGDTLMDGLFTRIDGNAIETTAYLTDPAIRPMSTSAFTAQWRRTTPAIPGLESLRFEADRGGPGSGAAITVELSHSDSRVLEGAGERLADLISEFPQTSDIDDGYTPGKRQFDLSLRPAARALGFTARSLARQVRDAFQGAEALKQQRGRNEITVRLRRPDSERSAEADIAQLLVRSPQGVTVPLCEIAEISRGHAYTAIARRNGRRTIEVTANVDPIGASSQIIDELKSEILPQLRRDFPGLSAGFEGRQADLRDSQRAMMIGLGMALIGIYVLLAIPFGSYIQPTIVMGAIPFGFVGALLGHIIMGYNISIISMMGLLALSGVVVNDSLVLIDYANRRRRAGASALAAIHEAGVRRFRPILLTTLTTFGGLAPMIFETSRQARFMVPMAISLGYGILFATMITLLIVPCLYLAIEDLVGLCRSSTPATRNAADAQS